MMLTGEFMTGETDLTVKVQGGTLKILRNYFDYQWHWNFNSTLKLTFTTAVSGAEEPTDPETINYNGSVYEKQDDDKYIFGNYQITIAARDSQGKPVGYRYQSKSGRWELFEHMIGGNIVAMTAFGDRNGTIGNILYDGQDRPVGMADRFDNQMIYIDYDTNDYVASVHDTQNRQVSYEHEEGQLTQITDILGAQEEYGYDSIGRITNYTNKLGVEETITYNNDSMVTSVEDSTGNWRQFDYGYDKQTREFYTMVKTAGGLIKEMWYDDEGYLVRVDINGETEKLVQKDGRNTSVVHPDGNETYKEYDIFDNVTKIIHPDGSTELYKYDLSLHKKTRHTNENGAMTQYEYDVW